MKKLILLWLLIPLLFMNASAAELLPPAVTGAAQDYVDEDAQTLGMGLSHLLQKALPLIRPDLAEASRTGLAVIAAVLMVGIVQSFPGTVKQVAELVGVTAIVSLLLTATNSLIRLGTDTIREMSDYGKLLLPVITAAMAAQGGITSSAALYGGTAVFDALLSSLISELFVPLVYVYVALAAASGALGDGLLNKMQDMIKGCVSWSLKTLLTVFTTYMGITGILSGSTDAAALKATKVTISTFVPVVGGILSDASEAVLVSAGLAKSAAGLYGILAILALFLEPFLKIGAHYLLLKITAAISGLLGSKRMSGVVENFSTAMGLLLGMTGSVCLLQLISTVCFMKGVGQ